MIPFQNPLGPSWGPWPPSGPPAQVFYLGAFNNLEGRGGPLKLNNCLNIRPFCKDEIPYLLFVGTGALHYPQYSTAFSIQYHISRILQDSQ